MVTALKMLNGGRVLVLVLGAFAEMPGDCYVFGRRAVARERVVHFTLKSCVIIRGSAFIILDR